MKARLTKRGLRTLEIGLWAAGIGSLALVALVWVEAQVHQARESRAFEQAHQAALAAAWAQHAHETDATAQEMPATSAKPEQSAEPEQRPSEAVPPAPAEVQPVEARTTDPQAAPATEPRRVSRQTRTPALEDLTEGSRSRRTPVPTAQTRAAKLTGPSRSTLELGSATLLARLRIPSTSLSVMVGEDSSASLRRGVAHIVGTARPGEEGNVGIAGHRDTFFRSLKDLRPGHAIVLETPGHEFHYQVSWTLVVEPRAVDVLGPTDTPSLTLVTCFPFQYVGDAPQRFIVRAERVE